MWLIDTRASVIDAAMEQENAFKAYRFAAIKRQDYAN